MAIYRCDECEQSFDNDWHVCRIVKYGDLNVPYTICPTCDEKLFPEYDEEDDYYGTVNNIS